MSANVCGEVLRKYSKSELSALTTRILFMPRYRVSLKNKIGVFELHRLISDVRRRVEHEITFEGTERRIK
jgi:hypothetical protein